MSLSNFCRSLYNFLYTTMSVKCSVKSCGVSKGKFYYFPVKGSERLQKWIAFCDNDKLLTLSEQQLRKRAICNAHFEVRYILNNRLTTNAIPTLSSSPGKSNNMCIMSHSNLSYDSISLFNVFNTFLKQVSLLFN